MEFSTWAGGFYERLVGMIKFSIQKSVESLCLTKTQLSTYAIKTEEIRNSRPLIYVDEDFNSANAVAITLPFEPYLENWLSISKQQWRRYGRPTKQRLTTK